MATPSLAAWPMRAGPSGPVTPALCGSHARRKFHETAVPGDAPIAPEATRRIAGRYAAEAGIRGRDPESRRVERRARAIVDALKPWLEAQLARPLRQSRRAEAIRWDLKRWNGHSHLLDDGRVEIDRNAVERAIGPLALDRETALFAGSDSGAGHCALVTSLVQTCKRNGVDPQAVVADLLERLVAGHPQSRIDDRMPRACAQP